MMYGLGQMLIRLGNLGPSQKLDRRRLPDRLAAHRTKSAWMRGLSRVTRMLASGTLR